MKICLSSKGNSLDSILDPRFGRAAYFAIVDTDTMDFEIIENAASVSGGGAGISSGQLMIDKDIKAVITGNVGPNAMSVLKTAEIEIYKGLPETLKDNMEKFKSKLLDKINTTVPEHFGMQGGK